MRTPPSDAAFKVLFDSIDATVGPARMKCNTNEVAAVCIIRATNSRLQMYAQAELADIWKNTFKNAPNCLAKLLKRYPPNEIPVFLLFEKSDDIYAFDYELDSKAVVLN